MTAFRRAVRLTLILTIGCALVACGGGDSGGTSEGGSTSKGGPGSGSGSGTSSPPPGVLLFQVTGCNACPGALLAQGSGYDVVGLDAVAQQSMNGQGAPLVSFQTTTLDSSGKQVGPITTTSLTGHPTFDEGDVAFNPTVQVPLATPGLFTLEGWVIDANGAKSGIATTTIQVVATSALATEVTETGPDPLSLIQSNGTLYWAESGEFALKMAPTGGGPATVLATRMLNPSSVVFSGSSVIWLDDRDGTAASCTASSITRVLKQTVASGFTGVLASGPSCGGGASQIALVGTTVYWVSSSASSGPWVINAAPLSGAAATTVRTTTTPIVALAANAGTLYWMENPYPNGTATILALTPGGMMSTAASGFTADANTFAVDSTSVYYATPNVPATSPPTETLWAQPLAGGAPLALVKSISTPVKVLSTLPFGGTSVVWMDQATVDSVPATGGAATQLASVAGTPIDVLYDGTNVRWSEITANMGQYGETGMIESVPLGGGQVTTVHQGGDAPRELAEDPQGRLNWTEGGPVGITEGFARIARLGTTGPAATVVSGINAAYTLSSFFTTLPTGLRYPLSLPLAATPTSLLIADQWRIKSLPIAGGQLTTVAAPDGGTIAGLATDGTSVYWDDSTSSVSKAPVAGGTITVLMPQSVLGGYSGPGGPIVLAPDGTLDWAVSDACPALATNCSSASIASAPSGVPSTSLTIISNQHEFVPSLAVNSTALYIPDIPLFNISVVGTSMLNAPVQYTVTPTAMALDSSALYWTGSSYNPNFAIYKGTINLPLIPNGQARPLLFFESPGNPLALALDSSYVYFADGQLIRKTPK